MVSALAWVAALGGLAQDLDDRERQAVDQWIQQLADPRADKARGSLAGIYGRAKELLRDRLAAATDPRVRGPLEQIVNIGFQHEWDIVRACVDQVLSVGVLKGDIPTPSFATDAFLRAARLSGVTTDPRLVVEAALYAVSRLKDVDENDTALASLLYTCGQEGSNRGRQAVKPYLKHRSFLVRLQAAGSWSELGGADDELAPLLNDDVPAVRLKAITSMRSPQGVERLVHDTDPQVRRAAAARLDASKQLNAVLKCLSDEDAGVVLAAIQVLSNARAVRPIVDRLSDPRGVVRLGALDAVERLRAREASSAVVALLKDESAGVRERALQVLERIGSAEQGAAVAELLKDPNVPVRQEAMTALAKFGLKDFAKAIAEQLKDRQVAVAAMTALGSFKATAYAKEVAKFVKDGDPFFANAAIRALGEMGAKDVAADIASRLLPDQGIVCAQAIQTLAKMGVSDYAETIVALVKSPSREVRAAVGYWVIVVERGKRSELVDRLLADQDNYVGSYATLYLSVRETPTLSTATFDLAGATLARLVEGLRERFRMTIAEGVNPDLLGLRVELRGPCSAVEAVQAAVNALGYGVGLVSDGRELDLFRLDAAREYWKRRLARRP